MNKEKKIKTISKNKKTTIALPSDSLLSLDFKNILLMLAIVVFLNLCFFPSNKMSVNHTLNGTLENGITSSLIINALNMGKSDVVFIGNSMLTRGIDKKKYKSLTGISVQLIGTGGAESAWWYLAFKNGVCKSDYHIKTAVFFFRDNELTEPSERVTDDYKSGIDILCEANEPLLDRLAYYNDMSDLELMISNHWPLYQKRKDFKMGINAAIKKKINKSFSNAAKTNIEKATENIFADTNMNQQLFTKYQFKIDKKTASFDFDFNNKVKKSFLPEIISLAKQNNIKLIFVRVKKRRDLIPNSQPPELIQYVNNLNTYLKKENLVMLDFTNERRIKEENYTDGDHQDNMNAPRVFTQILADTLPQYYAK